MEMAREFHRPLYMCFIDLRKAYDSVNQDALWSVLHQSYHLLSKLLFFKLYTRTPLLLFMLMGEVCGYEQC